MPTFNIDTAAAVSRLERVGILAEADAEHVTKTDLHVLEQATQYGLRQGRGHHCASPSAHRRNRPGGLAVATAILLTLG